jgi:hypothetical protein
MKVFQITPYRIAPANISLNRASCLNFVVGLTQVSLRDILIFATGASKIPPMGFSPQPTLSFWEDVRPKANTCGTVMFLPTALEVEKFQEMMDDGIMNSPFFGMA